MRKSLAVLAAAGLAVAGVASQAQAQDCPHYYGSVMDNDVLSATDGVVYDINADVTWGDATHPSPICLSEPAFVQDGVTLTILPGTIVRGQPRRAAPGAQENTPGAVIVTQGGRIIADGNAQAPIIMTTNAVDNDGDGVCDDGNGDGFFDPRPGYQDNGCIGAGTCGAGDVETEANAVFCDADPANNPNPPLASDGTPNLSQWGGLVLEGRAPLNTANQSGTPEGHGTFYVEGLQIPGFTLSDAVCGGVEPHDSSGILRYVSVRHAGDEIGFGNELNGVTVCGIGDNTIIEYVEVYSNFDDGFEFFGGTSSPNHLVVEYAGDDQLDMDLGYTGTIQFAFTVMPFFNQNSGANFGSKSGNKMGEFDGDDQNADDPPLQANVNIRAAYSPAIFPADPLAFATPSADKTPWPLSGPYIANWTGIGITPNGANPAVSPANSGGEHMGVQMRHGFAGQVANSVFVNTRLGSHPACLTIDTDTGEAPAGHDATDHVAADLIRWIANSCDDSAALAAGAGNAAGAADNGDAFALLDTQGMACTANVRASGGGFSGLTQEDPGFDPTTFGASGGAGPYDPRPAVPAEVVCGITSREPGLDRAATYRGAFVPDANTELWTTGWTVLNLAGWLAN